MHTDQKLQGSLRRRSPSLPRLPHLQKLSSCCRDAKVQDPSLILTRPVRKGYVKALEDQTYLSVDEASKDGRNVMQNIEKWAQKIQTRMRDQTFDASQPLSVLRFLPAVELQYDTSGIHKGDGMWLLYLSMIRSLLQH